MEEELAKKLNTMKKSTDATTVGNDEVRALVSIYDDIQNILSLMMKEIETKFGTTTDTTIVVSRDCYINRECKLIGTTPNWRGEYPGISIMMFDKVLSAKFFVAAYNAVVCGDRVIGGFLFNRSLMYFTYKYDSDEDCYPTSPCRENDTCSYFKLTVSCKMIQ